MDGRSGPTGGSRLAVAKGTTDPAAKHAALQGKKATFKSEMKQQLAQKTAAMEKKDLTASAKNQPKALKPLKGKFAESMMAQLNEKAKHMAKSAWHSQVKAVTEQDLATAQWDSAKRSENKGMGVDTTLYGKYEHAKPALTVGSSTDDTEISVSDGAHTDRLKLEKQMEAELNSKAQSIEHKNFEAIARASMPRKDKHAETDLVKKEAAQAEGLSRERLEKTLESSIRSIDHVRGEALYHKGLVKEKFDGAVVSSAAIDH